VPRERQDGWTSISRRSADSGMIQHGEKSYRFGQTMTSSEDTVIRELPISGSDDVMVCSICRRESEPLARQ
jgi:hypothetical protein